MNSIKILSFQTFSLYQNGGASRVLRRLFEGKEQNVVSLYIYEGKKIKQDNFKIQEIAIPLYPLHRAWMRSFLRISGIYLREKFFFKWNLSRIHKAIEEKASNTIHVIDHGLYPGGFILGYHENCNKDLWVSFHDHFKTTHSNIDITQMLWNRANRRLVISEELGIEYQNCFGKKNFDIITDGLDSSEISKPVLINSDKTISLYFAGLLHMDYLPLFETLAIALDKLSSKYKFKLILRGTQKIKNLENRNFMIDYRQDYIDDALIKAEMDNVDLLYLPIKFTDSYFYKFSFSTKMISYLGARGTILYHGPSESAVAKMLATHSAAISSYSLDVSDIVSQIEVLLTNPTIEFSINAKILAENSFLLKEIKQKFWDENSEIHTI